MSGTPSPGSFALSDCLTPAQLEQLYYDVVLRHDFYGDSYGADWNIGPYDEMAALLAEIFEPRQHVDVGCGKGFLVLAMRRRGIDSFGIDFSPALIKQAPQEAQPYLKVATAENWISSGAVMDADLITYMEVFEHLPVNVCASVLQTLRENFHGRLLITTPSYGVDDRWHLGIVTNEDVPTWREDMARNVPFRQIVLQDGLPHHGHITLCSYRWWSEFFLLNGWVRSLDLESKASKEFGTPLRKYHWNPYILERLLPDIPEIDVATSNQLGNGWYDAERAGHHDQGRWTSGRAEIYVDSTKEKLVAVEIVFTAPSVNVVVDYTLSIVVEQQIKKKDYELSWEPIYSSLPISVPSRETLQALKIEVRSPNAHKNRPRESPLFRLTILSPSFSPRDYDLSTDDRTLGLFVHRVAIESS